MAKATYRELIQDIHTRLSFTYGLVGALRDAATQNEKEIFDHTRGILGQLASQWSRFDNQLSDNRAGMVLPWELPDWKIVKDKKRRYDDDDDDDGTIADDHNDADVSW